MLTDKDLTEFVGGDPKVAQEKLQERFPDMRVNIVATDGMVTADYRLDRLRVYYDRKSNKVTSVRNG